MYSCSHVHESVHQDYLAQKRSWRAYSPQCFLKVSSACQLLGRFHCYISNKEETIIHSFSFSGQINLASDQSKGPWISVSRECNIPSAAPRSRGKDAPTSLTSFASNDFIMRCQLQFTTSTLIQILHRHKHALPIAIHNLHINSDPSPPLPACCCRSGMARLMSPEGKMTCFTFCRSF